MTSVYNGSYAALTSLDNIYELDNVLAKAVTSLCPNSEHISLKASS